MLFQIYDRDGCPFGLLKTMFDSGLYANKIEKVAKTIWDRLEIENSDTSGDGFWDAITEELAKVDIVAERVFATEIYL